MHITRLKLRGWRNFNRAVELELGPRAFFVGPNASGKSNILDALRFLRDVAAGGLRLAVEGRGGVGELRSLDAKRFPGFLIEVDLGVPSEPPRWSYSLHIRKQPRRALPVVMRETVLRRGETILDRPSDRDGIDSERLTQTHLEQVTSNESFREIADFFRSIRYLHLVPHIVRAGRRNGISDEDPYGSDLLDRMASPHKRTRDARLRRIQEALRSAVPQFDDLQLERDAAGNWRLYATYEHWRGHNARQSETSLSDGTLRLLGLFWALLDEGGPLLLEEPELSLHDRLVARVTGLMARMQVKSGRQTFVTTHSTALLEDEGIDLREIFLLVPGSEGTEVRSAADCNEIRELVEAGFNPGEAVMPSAAPKGPGRILLPF